MVGGLVTVHRAEHYFCSCSNCTIEIRKKYSIDKEFADDKHDECLDEIDIYFNLRIGKEIRGK